MTANTSSLSGTIFVTIAVLLAGADCTSAAERLATVDSSYCLQNPCPPDSTVRDLQDHGAPVAESDHQSGDDRDLAGGTLPRLGWPLVLGGLAACETRAGAGTIWRPRLFFTLGAGFRC